MLCPVTLFRMVGSRLFRTTLCLSRENIWKVIGQNLSPLPPYAIILTPRLWLPICSWVILGSRFGPREIVFEETFFIISPFSQFQIVYLERQVVESAKNGSRVSWINLNNFSFSFLLLFCFKCFHLKSNFIESEIKILDKKV